MFCIHEYHILIVTYFNNNNNNRGAIIIIKITFLYNKKSPFNVEAKSKNNINIIMFCILPNTISILSTVGQGYNSNTVHCTKYPNLYLTLRGVLFNWLMQAFCVKTATFTQHVKVDSVLRSFCFEVVTSKFKLLCTYNMGLVFF